ncbi:SIR2 family protein [Methylomicrobium sp. Wu6]|uniref:SIR2 family protein n=1 Tax=Methylomicrobium sp. Wu6 TaxID=3107928 RepID=UPI002DD65BEB|nr:SIR2 family protein [Methylomicrobium sp. Wu6]MEC4750585.1 SIR2 family protein [Methylomicrobium sp. Wu6]
MPQKKKILVVVGAGASIELGMPSVKCINILFSKWAQIGYPLASNEYGNLYSFFVREIERYKKNHLEKHLRSATNFEEVLYVLYLLPAVFLNGIFTSPIGAFLSGRKLPDIRCFGHHRATETQVLNNLASDLTKSLLFEFRKRCQNVKTDDKYKNQLIQWNGFLSQLDNDFELAIVNLNYDDLVYQALRPINTGFASDTGLFKPETIFYRKIWRCLLHLHGSVHFDFWERNNWLHDLSKGPDLEALKARGRSSRHTKEGLIFPGSEIVLGYGKLSQLQPEPFRTYHAELGRLVHECEGVLFLGYGFQDDHLNSAFSGFHHNGRRPVVIIDKAKRDTMTVRSSYDILPALKAPTFPFSIDPHSMKWLNYSFPTKVEKLNEIDEFESSTDPNTPLSIWYGGMQKACFNYQKIVNILRQ